MGRFEQGQPKPLGSGRKRGSKNKKSQMLQQILEDSGLHLPTKLIELLPTLKPEKQADVLLGLMSFTYPKLKAVEHSSSAESEAPKPFIIEFVKAKTSQR